MTQYLYKERTFRNLPHRHPPDTTLFVTFRLAETAPKTVLQQYQAEKQWWESMTKRMTGRGLTSDSSDLEANDQKLRKFHRKWFLKFEDLLHREACGPTWLKDERIAKIVVDGLHYRDGKEYCLDAYCIMSNHVHAVFSPFLAANDLREARYPDGIRFFSPTPPLDRIMKSLKGYTAWRANGVIGRKGPFWHPESYDHVVRDRAALYRIVNYVLNNPVKIGLVGRWQDWRWNYRRDSL